MLSLLLSRNAVSPVSFLERACICIVLAATLLPVIPSRAQTVNLGDDVSRPIPGVGHDYVKGLNETVNPANGSLNVKIDLPVPKGRGLTLPFAITYDSNEVFHYVSPGAGAAYLDSMIPAYLSYTDRSAVGHGWADTLPYVAFSEWYIGDPYQTVYNEIYNCAVIASYNFYDPEGGSHQLGLAGLGAGNPTGEGYAQACNGWPGGNSGFTYISSVRGGDDQVLAEMDANCNGDSYGTSYPPECAGGAAPFIVTDAPGTTYSFVPVGMGSGISQFQYPASFEFMFPQQIEDRNGNIIRFSTSGELGTGGVLPVVDTLGNPIISAQYPSSQGSGPYGAHAAQPSSYTVGGLTYHLTYTTTSASYTGPSPTQVYPMTGTPYGGETCQFNTVVNEPSIPVLSSIELPNGQFYRFGYDSTFGLLNEIDYPDGGKVVYTWGWSGTNLQLATFDGVLHANSPPYPGYCGFTYQTPVITDRKVYYPSYAQEQTFSYSVPGGFDNHGNWSERQTTVATTDVQTKLTSQTIYTYLPFSEVPINNNTTSSLLPIQLPLESTVAYYDWGNTTAPVETVTKTWYDQFLLKSQTTAFYGGPQSTTKYYWERYGSFPSLSEKDEFDYSNTSSTPSRSTTYQFGYTFSLPCLTSTTTYPVSGTACQSSPPYPNFQNWHPISLAMPTEIDTYNGAASGTPAARTNASYDGAAPTWVGVISGTHDESNYGASLTAGRGNVTSAVKWLNGGTSLPTKTFTYDSTGQVTSMKDPCGNASCSQMSGSNHTTTYSYTDSGTNIPTDPVTHSSGPTNAYLTTIKDPLGFSESFTYNYATGELTSATDENLNETDYSYDDPLLRLRDVYGPKSLQNGTARPHTHYDYVDGPGASVTTTKLQTPDPTVTSVSILDGMGHVVQTQTSDPAETVYTTTIYDGLGHVYQQSNPTRCSSSSPGTMPTSCSENTWGITTFAYDSLGRMTRKTNQDNSVQTWIYTGNTTKFTNELSNSWTNTVDAFGQLTKVVEPTGAKTYYTYDSLGNLTCAAQDGGNSGTFTSCASADASWRPRNFSYDSLSRLITAANPETGAVCYGIWSNGTCSGGYDANGNLVAKTDARGVATNYDYDALNRVISKTYGSSGNPDPFKTPITCYQYDNTASGANGVGRLWQEWTQPAGTSCTGSGSSYSPASGQFLTLKSLTYDAMGRLASAQQQHCIGSKCTAATPYALTLGYDLAGNMNSLVNSVGAQGSPLTLTHSYDAASRPCLTTSSWMSGFSPNLFQTDPTTGYAASSGLQNWYLGSDSSSTATGCTTSPSSPINLQQGYDNRLRVTGFWAAGQVP